jgi:hypothetical protein
MQMGEYSNREIYRQGMDWINYYLLRIGPHSGLL